MTSSGKHDKEDVHKNCQARWHHGRTISCMDDSKSTGISAPTTKIIAESLASNSKTLWSLTQVADFLLSWG